MVLKNGKPQNWTAKEASYLGKWDNMTSGEKQLKSPPKIITSYDLCNVKVTQFCVLYWIPSGTNVVVRFEILQHFILIWIIQTFWVCLFYQKKNSCSTSSIFPLIVLHRKCSERNNNFCQWIAPVFWDERQNTKIYNMAQIAK